MRKIHKLQNIAKRTFCFRWTHFHRRINWCLGKFKGAMPHEKYGVLSYEVLLLALTMVCKLISCVESSGFLLWRRPLYINPMLWVAGPCYDMQLTLECVAKLPRPRQNKNTSVTITPPLRSGPRQHLALPQSVDLNLPWVASCVGKVGTVRWRDGYG